MKELGCTWRVPSARQTMTVVVSCVRSGPAHCVLLMGCADGAAGVDAAAELLWSGTLAPGASAAGATHPGQVSAAGCWLQRPSLGVMRLLPLTFHLQDAYGPLLQTLCQYVEHQRRHHISRACCQLIARADTCQQHKRTRQNNPSLSFCACLHVAAAKRGSCNDRGQLQ